MQTTSNAQELKRRLRHFIMESEQPTIQDSEYLDLTSNISENYWAMVGLPTAEDFDLDLSIGI